MDFMNRKLPADTLIKAMARASSEARKWLGATSPNPAVGAAALDASGEIIAVNAHRRAGEAHAEAALIDRAREQGWLEKIDTLCVTLEPCNHHGKTPPCSEAIIGAGIKRVAIGARDPNPQAAGGAERLRQVGVEVVEDIAADECRQLLHAFAYSVQSGKPWITIKRAFTKSGSMTPPPGQKTFTSPESLRLAHRLRKKADAIITGSGTVLADNPLFTVRHVADHPGKQRGLVIMDRRHRVLENYLAAARERNLDAVDTHDSIETVVRALGAKGGRDILVEAGPTFSQAMLDSGLWCMDVSIHEGDPDRVEVKFNPRLALSFRADKFNWEWILPA